MTEWADREERLDVQAAALRRAGQACLAAETLRLQLAQVLEQRAEAVRDCAVAGMGPREITDGISALCLLWKHPTAGLSYETVRADLRVTRRSGR